MKHLKYSILLWGLILAPGLARADSVAPKMINLQAVLVDDGGNVLYDLQETDVTFSIIDGAGTTYYEETQHIPVVNGAVSVLVGNGNDPASGSATGGIPYDALSPDGDRLLRIKLADQTIPQEDLQLVSVPYSYYAEYALNVSEESIESGDILNGTIQQADLSADLLAFIDSSISGVSEQDLLDHVTASGAHAANVISVENSFVNIAATNVQEALENIDAALNLRTTDIDAEVSARDAADTTLQTNIDNEATTRANADTTLQSNIDAEASLREAADTALDGRVDTLESTATDLQNQITQEVGDRQTGDSNEALARASADTALDGRVDKLESTATDLQNQITQEVGDRQTGDSNEATARASADSAEATARASADNSEASTRASADTTLQTNIDGKVNRSGDTMTGDLTVGDGSGTDLTVNADVSVGDDLDVAGTATVSGSATVSGNMTVGNGVATDLTVVANLDVGGNITVSDSLSSGSNPSANTIYANNLIFAWANVDDNGTILGGGFNVKNVVDESNCRYTVYFETNASSAYSYAVTGSVIGGSTDNLVTVLSQDTTGFMISAGESDGNCYSGQDEPFSVIVVGY